MGMNKVLYVCMYEVILLLSWFSLCSVLFSHRLLWWVILGGIFSCPMIYIVKLPSPSVNQQIWENICYTGTVGGKSTYQCHYFLLQTAVWYDWWIWMKGAGLTFPQEEVEAARCPLNYEDETCPSFLIAGKKQNQGKQKFSHYLCEENKAGKTATLHALFIRKVQHIWWLNHETKH